MNNYTCIRFSYNDEISHADLVQRGVPKGCVLGLILFVIFINDLPVYLTLFYSKDLYADDTYLRNVEQKQN